MWWASSRPWAASQAVAATKPPRGPRKPATPLQRAVRMLARRDMSRAELATRLGAGRRPGRTVDDVGNDHVGPDGECPDPAEYGAASSVPVAAAGADAASSAAAAPKAQFDSTELDAAELDATAIDATLDRLQALGLQSDSRFAENYVRGRQARTGSRRLAAELRQRGVDGDTIGEALATLGESDLQRAHALWARRFSATRDPRERNRQMRFLAARGFDMGVIRAVVGGAGGDDPELPGDTGLPDDPG
jgi:regulatory protein